MDYKLPELGIESRTDIKYPDAASSTKALIPPGKYPRWYIIAAMCPEAFIRFPTVKIQAIQIEAGFPNQDRINITRA
jgi:hypothetical protein